MLGKTVVGEEKQQCPVRGVAVIYHKQYK